MKHISRQNIIIWSIAIIYFTAMALYLESAVPFHISFKEQTSIFIYGQDLLWEYFTKPAALSCIIGDFLTQFFAFKHTGTFIIIVLFAVLLVSVRKALQILSDLSPAITCGIAFLVTSVECALFTGIDWDITLCIGLVFALETFVLLDKCRNSKLQYLLVAIAFPLIGGYTLMLAMLIICSLIKRNRYIAPVIIAAESILAILLFSRIEMFHYGQAIVYPLASHSLSASPYRIFITFIIIAVFFILSALADSNSRITKAIVCPVCAVLSVLAFIWTYNGNSEHILKLSTYTYKRDWDKAEKAVSTNPDNINTYDILVYNCALARKGELPVKLFRYPQTGLDGMFLAVNQFSTYIDHFFNVDFHLELGDLTWATDCSFLGQTQVRGCRPSRMIRRSAEIAVLAGDSALAEKYLNMLAHSIPHKKWAISVRDGLRSGKLPKDLVRLGSLTPESDCHFNQNDHKAALIATVQGNPDNNIALDYLLCAYILDKDLKNFASAFHTYYDWNNKANIPQVYQEALIASASNMDKLKEIAAMYPINQQLLTAYMQFSRAIQTGDKKTAKKFSGSYWDYLLSYGK